MGEGGVEVGEEGDYREVVCVVQIKDGQESILFRKTSLE